jgi:NAD(P)H-dependent flavin oxidoreductase YrpB (nitropropane dioxygenase family)
MCRIDVPILNAPMASGAGGERAAAVSAAGGLEFVGATGHDAARRA